MKTRSTKQREALERRTNELATHRQSNCECRRIATCADKAIKALADIANLEAKGFHLEEEEQF